MLVKRSWKQFHGLFLFPPADCRNIGGTKKFFLWHRIAYYALAKPTFSSTYTSLSTEISSSLLYFKKLSKHKITSPLQVLALKNRGGAEGKAEACLWRVCIKLVTF